MNLHAWSFSHYPAIAAFCLIGLLTPSVLAQTADQSATIDKVLDFLGKVKDRDLANKIKDDFKNKRLTFDAAVNRDDPSTAAWYDPRTGLININTNKVGEVLAKSPGDGSNYGTISLAATLKHEYVHKAQPAAMHRASMLNDVAQTRARETPAYDTALKGFKEWADVLVKDVALTELAADGLEKAGKMSNLGYTLGNLKNSYKDYLVGVRENRDAGNLDPNFEWTAINGATYTDPSMMDSVERLNYSIKKATDLTKTLKSKGYDPQPPKEGKDQKKTAAAKKVSKQAGGSQKAISTSDADDEALRKRVIAALSRRGLGAPDALVSHLAGILERQGEAALNNAINSLVSMQGSFTGSGFTLLVKDGQVSGSFYDRSEYRLPNAKVSVTVTDGTVAGWIDPSTGDISFDVHMVVNVDGQISELDQKMVGTFSGRGYKGHVAGDEEAKWQITAASR